MCLLFTVREEAIEREREGWGEWRNVSIKFFSNISERKCAVSTPSLIS